MTSTPSELKARARAELPSEIAGFVEQEIDKQAAPLSTERPLEGIRTAYLGDQFYRGLPFGRFSGRPIVQWNGPDSFMFIKDATAPFSYTTANGRVVRPRSMTTDGGSIPRLLHALQSFSPWGYGPAYIIHDWFFEAHRHALAPDNDWEFENTALALAECIKSLMENGFVAADGNTIKLSSDVDSLYLIYQAVRSPFARRLWDKS